jgi:membrane protease YdiL (CAAX protease family)
MRIASVRAANRDPLPHDSPKRTVITFLALALILCSPFYVLIVSAGTLSAAGGLYVLAMMWCPGIAALITRAWLQRNFHGIGWGWGAHRYQVAGYLIPACACVAVYCAAWITGLGGISTDITGRDLFGLAESSRLPVTFILTGTVVILEMMLFTAGEEIGWRGLLAPELAKLMGYTGTSLVTGLIWAAFHFPLIIFADYSSGAPVWFAVLSFTLGITAGSFIVTWLRLRSGSVWTAVLMHASHNAWVGLFDRLTVENDVTPYVTSEFGLGLALVYGVLAYWCWTHRAVLGQTRVRDFSLA